ncbi:MAG: hypothetical protein ACOX18_07160 [Bacillota bacterium]
MAERVEAYVGEYASGKSEVAVNRALMLQSGGEQVTLVDLDLVEPTYTLRPLKRQLEALGLDVIAWETAETLGLGEAGAVLHPAAPAVLRRPGSVVLDVGYGVYGSDALNLIDGAWEHPRLQVIMVFNTSRPLTHSVADIVREAQSIRRVDALLNNTHRGDETSVELVQAGARVVAQAARQLNRPVLATCAVQAIAAQIGPEDACGHPVWPLRRFLPAAFW